MTELEVVYLSTKKKKEKKKKKKRKKFRQREREEKESRGYLNCLTHLVFFLVSMETEENIRYRKILAYRRSFFPMHECCWSMMILTHVTKVCVRWRCLRDPIRMSSCHERPCLLIVFWFKLHGSTGVLTAGTRSGIC